MKAIYFRNKKNRECYKLEIYNENQAYIDKFLDALNPKDSEFITESEFVNSHDKWMKVQLQAPDSTEIVGCLTTKEIKIEMDIDEFVNLNFKDGNNTGT